MDGYREFLSIFILHLQVMHECAKPSAALLCQHGLMMANVFDVQVSSNVN